MSEQRLLPGGLAVAAAAASVGAAAYLVAAAPDPAVWAGLPLSERSLLASLAAERPLGCGVGLLALGSLCLWCRAIDAGQAGLRARLLAWGLALLTLLGAASLELAQALTLAVIEQRAETYRLLGAPGELDLPWQELPSELEEDPALAIALLDDEAELVDRDNALDAVRDLGPEALPYVRGACATRGFPGRLLALQALAELLHPEDLPVDAESLTVLVRNLAPDQPLPVRRRSAAILLELKDLRCVEGPLQRADRAVPELSELLAEATGLRNPSPIEAFLWWQVNGERYPGQLGAREWWDARLIASTIGALDDHDESPQSAQLSRLLVGRGPEVLLALERATEASGPGQAWAARTLADLLGQLEQQERPDSALAALLRAGLEWPEGSPQRARVLAALTNLADPRWALIVVENVERCPDLKPVLAAIAGQQVDDPQAWWTAEGESLGPQLQPGGDQD